MKAVSKVLASAVIGLCGSIGESQATTIPISSFVSNGVWPVTYTATGGTMNADTGAVGTGTLIYSPANVSGNFTASILLSGASNTEITGGSDYVAFEVGFSGGGETVQALSLSGLGYLWVGSFNFNAPPPVILGDSHFNQVPQLTLGVQRVGDTVSLYYNSDVFSYTDSSFSGAPTFLLYLEKNDGAPAVGSWDNFNIATSSVPEPSTWAMMTLGFAGLGFMAYRRKPKSVLTAA